MPAIRWRDAGPALPRLDAAGIREVRILGAWLLTDAAAMAAELPAPTDGDLTPVGWGVFPPEDLPVVVTVRRGARAVDRTAVPARHHGIVCCLWSSPAGPVFRLSFPGDEAQPAIHPVDVMEDQIQQEQALRTGAGLPVPLRRPGWCLCRLDPDPATAREAAARAAVDAALRRGK